MIVAEAMRKEGNPRFAAGSVAWVLHAELGGVGRILGMAQDRGEERQSEKRRKSFEANRHDGLRWF
jgi:hypothetical protein